MAAGKCGWQSYNFPFSDQEIVSQSFIDYSSASMLNINLDEHDRTLVIHSKKSHNSRPQRLVAKHQSLPFLGPNVSSSSLPVKTVNDCHLSGFLRRDELSFDSPSVHVDNFSVCHPDIMYGTVADLLREEINCPPWSNCRNIRHDLDLSVPWKRRERLCQMCSKMRDANPHQDNSYFQVIKHLRTTLPDISPSLLENLLQESIPLETSQLHFDAFMGNSLACHVVDASHQALLVYPSGPGQDTLNFSNISQFSESVDVDSSSVPYEPILSRQQFSLQGQIRQIDFSSFSGTNIVGTRSQYNCSFFQSYKNDSNEANSLSFKPLETVAVTKQAMCVAVSPYVPGEGVVMTETGGTYLWRCGQDLTTVCPSEQCDNNDDSPWYQCVYAANPLCIAMANTKAVDLLDFRAGKLFQRFFFSIPSPEVNSFECISSIQRHPQNFHHYILATDQSLMLLDDRYLQHPVLKWRHHNEDPVQFINVVCDAFPQCDDTVLVISGSNHQQTHCFEYSGSQVYTEKPSAATMQQSFLPPQSTSLPWKVSSYSEWYHEGLCNGLTFSQAASSRLSQPLIGVCTLPHTSHPQKGFTVFQMSSAGDLFYQPFFSQGIRSCEEGQGRTEQGQELSTKTKILCQKWIDMSEQWMEDLEKTTSFPVDFDYVELDKSDLCLGFLSLPSPHPNCVLCNDIENVELDHADGDSNICIRCGLDVSYSSKLAEHKVLTTSSLGIQYEVKDLEIFPDFNKATDPLSKSLFMNWTSDEPIPVFSDGPTQVNTEKPIVPDTRDGPIPVHTVKPISINNNKPSLEFGDGSMHVNGDKQAPANNNRPPLVNDTVPTLLNADKPVLLSSKKPVIVSNSRPIPLRNEEPMLELLSREKGVENQDFEERTKANFLTSHDYSLLPSVMLPVRMTPKESSTSKQDLNNTPKKKKRTAHVMGF